MLALALYFLVSHTFSFICSIFEAVLLSCTDAYVALLKKRGSSSALVLEELKSEIDRPLAAILTLNTVSHTIGAAGVGASIVELFGDKWLALGSIILTLTMLYWTEMLPKTIGAVYWKGMAPWCAKPIKWLIIITYPFVYSFNLFARFVSRKRQSNRISEEDIRLSLEVGKQAGVIKEAEQDMLENIFRLGDRRVGVLMRPRVDIEWIDVKDSIDEIREIILTSKHHHFPVCKDHVDNVIGLIHSRDILSRVWKGERVDIENLVTPAVYVNENQHIFELMDLFRKHHELLALVTDEYGTIQGIITIADVINAIIKGVEEETEAKIVEIDNRSWLADGALPIDEFKDFFHFEHLPEEERARYRTLSGLCMNQLDSVPKKGETFTLGSYRFEVLKVRKRRVEKVLIKKEI